MSANPALDYHEHLSVARDEYEEHAHDGNTPGHEHPDQELGPRYEAPEPATWWTLKGTSPGKSNVATACGAPGCQAVVWCQLLGTTYLAQLLRSQNWSQTKARGWVCPEHRGRK